MAEGAGDQQGPGPPQLANKIFLSPKNIDFCSTSRTLLWFYSKQRNEQSFLSSSVPQFRSPTQPHIASPLPNPSSPLPQSTHAAAALPRSSLKIVPEAGKPVAAVPAGQSAGQAPSRQAAAPLPPFFGVWSFPSTPPILDSWLLKRTGTDFPQSPLVSRIWIDL